MKLATLGYCREIQTKKGQPISSWHFPLALLCEICKSLKLEKTFTKSLALWRGRSKKSGILDAAVKSTAVHLEPLSSVCPSAAEVSASCYLTSATLLAPRPVTLSRFLDYMKLKWPEVDACPRASCIPGCVFLCVVVDLGYVATMVQS